MRMIPPSSRRGETGAANAVVLVLLAVLIFGAGVMAAWWWLGRRAATPVAAASPAADFGPLTPSPAGPEAEAGPSAAPSPLVADAGATQRPPRPGRRVTRPPVAPGATAGQLLSQAESAASEKRYADAADLYERALQVDPKNQAALSGRARIAAMGAGRRFVLGQTVVESLKPVGRDLDGFDIGSGVGVKRAPRVEGQLELVMEPAGVTPGSPYAVKVFLRNEGKKSIDVDELKVSMIVDGKWSTRPLPPKVKQVAPRQRVLIEELPGIWRAGVNDWAVEAVLTSKVQDVYRNRLTWK
ncbi:MAG TPA: hypothetical protein VMR21_17410 [Vicinamibacteria bacterium]|nr:hypothetical protein [Vicinamibacteria bacterium]